MKSVKFLIMLFLLLLCSTVLLSACQSRNEIIADGENIVDNENVTDEINTGYYLFQTKSTYLLNDKMVEQIETYREDGKIISSSNNEGVNIVYTYDENGIISSIKADEEYDFSISSKGDSLCATAFVENQEFVYTYKNNKLISMIGYDNGEIISGKEYNEAGQTVKEYINNHTSITCSYENEKLVEQTIIYDGTIDSSYEWKYEGDLLIYEKSENGSMSFYRKLEKKGNNLYRYNNYDSNDTFCGYSIVETNFISSGSIEKESFYNSENELQSYRIIKRDLNDNIIENCSYDSNDEVTSKTINVYKQKNSD